MSNKFHINDEGEVKRCEASVKQCQFGGGDANNHFDTVYEANAEATRRNVDKYGELNTQMKRAVRIREKEEFAPRSVPNALTVEEVNSSKKKVSSTFKSFNEIEELGMDLEVKTEKDLAVVDAISAILGDGEDDMMSDNGINDFLFELGNSDDANERAAAAEVFKIIRR